MLRQSLTLLFGAAGMLGASGAIAADTPLKGFVTVLPVTHAVPVPAAQARLAVKPLPTWTYNVTAGADLGGGTYTGTIIGASPYAATKGVTNIKVQIVPLVVTINDGTTTQVYDPTVADPCNTNHPAVTVVQQSPIFTHTTKWKMNGVSIGATQYIDAFQRAEFWSLVGGSKYHLLLKPTVLASQPEAFTGAAHGQNFNAVNNGGCGYIGIVNINDMDQRIRALITGPLASMINAGTFPIFITKDVVESTSGVSTSQCCVLGYHSGLTVGKNLQIYSPFAYDSSGLFGGDVTTLSHEMGEAINDPSGSNPTPTWGNIGQVKGQCQGNFEVGDPLSEGYGTPTTPFVIPAANGLTYHMQELAFLSWFYGSASLGAGGKYSNNSSFGGNAILCASGGGTN